MPRDGSGRRELADWLASADNPLTGRVYANRAWHWLFGAGLVFFGRHVAQEATGETKPGVNHDPAYQSGAAR